MGPLKSWSRRFLRTICPILSGLLEAPMMATDLGLNKASNMSTSFCFEGIEGGSIRAGELGEGGDEDFPADLLLEHPDEERIMGRDSTGHDDLPLQGIHFHNPLNHALKNSPDDVLEADLFPDLGQDLGRREHGTVAPDRNILGRFFGKLIEPPDLDFQAVGNL